MKTKLPYILNLLALLVGLAGIAIGVYTNQWIYFAAYSIFGFALASVLMVQARIINKLENNR